MEYRMQDSTLSEDRQLELVERVREQAIEKILAHAAGMVDAAINQLFLVKRRLGYRDCQATPAQTVDAAGLAESIVLGLADQLPLDPAEVVRALDEHCELVNPEAVVDYVQYTVETRLREVAKTV